jgi:hypothetical protein
VKQGCARRVLQCRLQLEEAARDHALQLRERYMVKLQELFHERQALNLEAVKVLLPQEVGALLLRQQIHAASLPAQDLLPHACQAAPCPPASECIVSPQYM